MESQQLTLIQIVGRLKMKTVKVMADCFNGNFVVNSFDDYDGCTVIGEQEFCDSLGTMSDDDIFGAELTEAMYKKIDNEYGIRK